MKLLPILAIAAFGPSLQHCKSPDVPTLEGNSPEERSGMAVTATFSVSCQGERPSRPPRRSFSCLVEAQGTGQRPSWLLLPSSLDHPLATPGTLTKIELVRSARGQLFLRAYGEPGFVAMRLEPGVPLRVDDWELSTLRNVLEGEGWVSDEVRIAGQGTLAELLAGALAPPADAPPTGAALLGTWVAPAGTQATMREPSRHAFAIREP